MPGGRSPACSVGESFERDGLGAIVSLLGLCQLVELLGNKAAEGHSTVSTTGYYVEHVISTLPYLASLPLAVRAFRGRPRARSR